MKKIKSRWFAMLLILSLVFTMGMPMGMTAFGAETTELDAAITAAATAAEDAAAKALLAEEAAKAATTAQEAADNAQTAADAAKATADAKVAEAALVDAADEAAKATADAAAADAVTLAATAQKTADDAKAEAGVKATAAKDAQDAADAAKADAEAKAAAVEALKTAGDGSPKKVSFSQSGPADVSALGSNETTPRDGDYLQLTLNSVTPVNNEGVAVGPAVAINNNQVALELVAAKPYKLDYTVANTYDPIFDVECAWFDFVHIIGINVNGAPVAPVSELVSNKHSHGGWEGIIWNHWKYIHASGPSKSGSLIFTTGTGPKTLPVVAAGTREVTEKSISSSRVLSYTAAVPVAKHLVTFSVVGSNGTLAAKVGTQAIVTGSEVNEGTIVDFEATPANSEDYRIKEWKVDGVAQIEKTLTLKKTVSKPIVVTVEFEKKTNATIKITGDDTYDLYVNGQVINPYGDNRTSWSKKDEYRVQLEGNYLIAAKVYDIGGGNITGLNVEVDFDDSKVADVKGASMWSWAKGQEGTGWYTAPSVTGWKPAVAINLDNIEPDNEWDNVDGTWIWSAQNDVTNNSVPVFFRCTGVAPEVPKHTIIVTADENGIAYIGSDKTKTTATADEDTELVLKAEPKEGYVFRGWDQDGKPIAGGPTLSVMVTKSTTYKAHFDGIFNYTLDLDPDDNSTGVAKNKVLKMIFNGNVKPFLKAKQIGQKALVMEKPDFVEIPDFRIYSADGKLFDSFNYMPSDMSSNGLQVGYPLVSPNPGSRGSITGTVVELDPVTDFVPGETYYVLVNGFVIEKIKEQAPPTAIITEGSMPQFSDIAFFMGFGEKDAVQDHDWNFTIASDAVTPGGPVITPATPITTVTTVTTRDKADPPVVLTSIPAPAVPLAAPVVLAPAAAPALAQVPDEAIALGVPVLPKTGEIPASLFYGIGGILAAAGAFMKRK